MKIKIFLLISVFFLPKTFSNNLDFWGETGHRTIGEITEHYLTKKAQKKIYNLLGGESLAFVSTFADEIKSDRKYTKYYTWHYINMGVDENYVTSKKNPKGDLVTGINTCISVLKNRKSTRKEKVFCLKMLVHLVGDLHQPLHLGRRKDKGGNSIQVQWFRKVTNLHSVWDTKMIEKWNMSYSELAKNEAHLSKEQINAIKKGSLIDWVNEGHQLTKKVYGSLKAGKRLGYRYSYNYFPLVREQLQKAGIRLAKLLNEIFV